MCELSAYDGTYYVLALEKIVSYVIDLQVLPLHRIPDALAVHVGHNSAVAGDRKLRAAEFTTNGEALSKAH